MGSQLPMGLTFLDLCGTPFQDENPSGMRRAPAQVSGCSARGLLRGRRAFCATPLVSLQTTVRLSLTQSALLAAAHFTTCPLSLCVSGPSPPLPPPSSEDDSWPSFPTAVASCLSQLTALKELSLRHFR